jgi:spore maturation protein CgeB
MRIVYFTHSLLSCWNHGNAHFQRGILRALQARGHTAIAYEPAQSWSRQNLDAETGGTAEAAFAAAFPDLTANTYRHLADLEAAVDGADLVIVHEWNDPDIVAQIGRLRATAGFTLLFHDTHHRAASEPQAIRRYDLSRYDGVLAFGETLAEIYRGWGWADRVFVWHEAADTSLFRPPAGAGPRQGAVWIGNWGDDERSAELETYLLSPASSTGVALDIHGVRYPPPALQMLQRYGANYHGWLANNTVPQIFARHRFTVHVPRRFYATLLPGIPTIRVFEALACGIPLLTAPWDDAEGLFRPGTDYLVGGSGAAMQAHMTAILNEPALAAHLASNGLARILDRHSCEVRATELLAILRTLRPTRVAA